MKVLQINSVCGNGSTGRIVTDLYDVLKNNGHECWIAYGRNNASKSYQTIKIGSSFSVYSNVLKSRLLDTEGFNAKNETYKFIDKIKKIEPDVIHLHNLHGYYLNIEILFKYLSKLDIPIFWTLHDCWAFSPHSAYIDYDSNGNLPSVATRDDLAEYPKSIMKNNSYQNYQKKKKLFTSVKNMTIICPSNWLATMVKQSFLSIFPVKVINNGIDLNEFKPRISEFRNKYCLEEKKILLGIASVWEERKGLKFFNKLAEELDNNYQIILVGIDKKNEKNVNNNIITIDKTNNVKELAEIYTNSDVFLNPTLEDNFPTTNIESLACGTPVITFNTGGSPESIDYNTGKVVEKGNYKELFNAVITFDYQKNYSNSCVEKSKEFNKNIIYENYIKMYNLKGIVINKNTQ